MKLKQKQDGFTIVELLIIIIVIGVLAGLIITSFSGFRQKERDKERQGNIKALQVAIEGYYAQNGKYPSLNELNDTAWRTKNIKALEADDLKDPQGTDSKLVTAPVAKAYSYDVKADDNTACDNKTKDCTKYTLTATYEGGTTFSKNNLN
jgi:type II secretory pathway pseudopilin PulG